MFFLCSPIRSLGSLPSPPTPFSASTFTTVRNLNPQKAEPYKFNFEVTVNATQKVQAGGGATWQGVQCGPASSAIAVRLIVGVLARPSTRTEAPKQPVRSSRQFASERYGHYPDRGEHIRVPAFCGQVLRHGHGPPTAIGTSRIRGWYYEVGRVGMFIWYLLATSSEVGTAVIGPHLSEHT